jgi:hypothetical protein
MECFEHYEPEGEDFFLSCITTGVEIQVYQYNPKPSGNTSNGIKTPQQRKFRRQLSAKVWHQCPALIKLIKNFS